jgi:hypothetical protein
MRATGLTSLQRREFRDRPAALLSDPGTPPALAAAAAVIAGEPRRVLRELDSADPDARSAPDWADLRTLASALDVN